MTVPPVPPPPPSARPHHDGGPATVAQHRAATVAPGASISGFVVFPVLGPIVGITVGFCVLWPLRSAPENSTSRLAAAAVAVGAAGVAVPVVAVLYLRGGVTSGPLLSLLATVAVVVAAAMHLARVGSRRVVLASTGSAVAVVAVTAAAIGGVLLAVWFLVTVARIVFSTLFGTTAPAVGTW